MVTRDRRVGLPVLAGLGGALTAALGPLLARMRRDLADDGGLRPTTTTAMYTTYAGWAGLLAAAATRGGLPVPPRAGRTAGATAIAAGLGVAAAGMVRFPGPRQVSGMGEHTLVTGGMYRWSRNPQYLGLSLAAAGVAVAGRSLPALLAAAVYPLVTDRWIRDEERHLERTYGDDYRAYRARTPRWLGRPGSTGR